ncbi:MAG: HIT family protein [archaeon]
MTDCDICKILKAKQSFKFIYEDDLCFAILHENPAQTGHALVIPKEHYPIFEQISDEIVSHIFSVANKVSVACFDSLHSYGTNIIVNNGTSAGQENAHFLIHVIPRKENDRISFEWIPNKASDGDLENALSMIKSVIDFPESSIPQPKKEEPSNKQSKNNKNVSSEDGLIIEDASEGEDYQTKQLRRTP